MNNDFMRWLLDLRTIPRDAEGLRLGLERPWEPWIWALIVIGAGLLAAWSYWRLTGRRGGRIVLSVARALLIVLVVLLIAGPVIELPRESVEQDWVLVLADRSASMTIADVTEQGAPGRGPERESRDAQLRALLADHGVMWDKLEKQRHVVWLGFHSGAFDLGEETSKRRNVETSKSGRSTPFDVSLGAPDGQRTSLSTSLEQALQRAAARPLSGVVVLSDGRTDDPPTRALVRRLQADAVPVFAVPLGSRDPLGDLAISRVDSPRRAFIRDQVPVQVEVSRLGSTAGSAGATVKLIDATTGEVLDQQELPDGQSGGNGSGGQPEVPQRLTLTARPALAGEANWRIVIETPPDAPPDLIPGNNVKEFALELIDRPLRVLYVEGYPRWEYRYVKNLLVREKSIDSSIMLLSADADFAQEGNQPITRLPRSPEEFAAFDVIIIGDVPGSFFSPQQLEMMRDTVAERGGGLLWIAGERSTPSTYGGTALADLLPMRGSPNIAAIGTSVNMRPTPVAERLGVLRLTAGERTGWPGELLDAAQPWSQLRYAQRLEPGRLKPTAEVLAETAQTFSGASLPLVVHMRYGAGQTTYVATDEVWRWRFARGELLPEQFWVQLIRMLGRESLGGADAPAVLTVQPARLPVNQPMRVVLRLQDAQLARQQRVGIAAVLEDAGGRQIAELDLRRVSSGTGSAGGGVGGEDNEFAATYLPDVVGQLQVRIDEPALQSFDLRAPVEVFRADDELRSPETDHALLANLASETGGAVLAPAEVDDLPQRLPKRAVTTINPLTEPIWDTPLAFILVVFLLTAEWIGRKLIRLT